MLSSSFCSRFCWVDWKQLMLSPRGRWVLCPCLHCCWLSCWEKWNHPPLLLLFWSMKVFSGDECVPVSMFLVFLMVMLDAESLISVTSLWILCVPSHRCDVICEVKIRQVFSPPSTVCPFLVLLASAPSQWPMWKGVKRANTPDALLSQHWTSHCTHPQSSHRTLSSCRSALSQSLLWVECHTPTKCSTMMVCGCCQMPWLSQWNWFWEGLCDLHVEEWPILLILHMRK